MRLRIIETDFTTHNGWFFKLANESGNDFYIMDDAYYKKPWKHKLPGLS